ncbi:MAG TPA: patatin-like phospholipase family protein [Ideonella sp.]|uniref:patatin-like phospholipase family protein n=1 Tax=Ideonella sp. TaxID=1929293 RepID=UPI002CDF7B80|nr:patatin-like phospholipase family protein [Ideonella sp.]HSI50033.1 patatin-like phospholipase family protein [Ideonella sp.]
MTPPVPARAEPPETATQAASADAATDGMAALVAARRAKLSAELRAGLDSGRWGLALSGGGVRSATFCFGLLKALAGNGIFHRFDLMSTVSGGGYIGAMVGKLFQEARSSGQGADKIEQALADADRRWFAFWLRANGRYLIPRGGQDTLFAAANFGRNLVGVHVELAVMSLLLGGLLVGFDLAIWAWADCIYASPGCWRPPGVSVDTLAVLSNWPTSWLLLPPLVWWGAVLSTTYWILPATAGRCLPRSRWLTAAVGLGLCLWLVYQWQGAQGADGAAAEGDLQVPALLMLCAGGMLLAWPVGTLMAWRQTRAATSEPDRSRNQLTSRLAATLQLGLVIAGLGLVDYLAWTLAKVTDWNQGAAGTAIALTVVVLRAVLPKISDLPRSLTPAMRGRLMDLANVLGALAVLVLLVFWISLLHRSATLSLFPLNRSSQLLQYRLSWEWLAIGVLPPLGMLLVSAHNREFLNRSSLFAFYRARLVRSYLGAANVQRFTPGTPAATAPYPRQLSAQDLQVAIAEVHPADDVSMADYQPHLAGGPVHLINVCLNQTRVPRGGLFNQDRKGLPMSVGPQGQVRVGPGDWRSVAAPGCLSLGSWTAISGAAVAPGLGASTRSGLAALLTLAGVRLGHWWDSSPVQRGAGEPLPPITGKYGQLLAELRGRFDGDLRRDWFLSDGGHFENTGAYALLREECRLIVLADCAADPRYAFGDLENLVRKARIDLQANIVFLKPRLQQSAAPPPPPEAADCPPCEPPMTQVPTAFGSLNDLASADSQACLALAQVHYRRSGKTGHLVIVKPNMCDGLPVDLVNFKADNPLFPQEPTTDQFFSEAQWESYFQLGDALGGQLTHSFICHLCHHAGDWFEPDDGSIAVADTSGEKHSQTAPKRLPSRIAATGAVTASISLGAMATLGATGWQAINEQLDKVHKARSVDPVVLKELTDLYGHLAPGPGLHPADTGLGEIATALLRISDASCNDSNSQAFHQSRLLQTILTSTRDSCKASSPRHPSCELLLNRDQNLSCLLDDATPVCLPQYWIRDYGASAGDRVNCPPVAPKLVTAALPPPPPPEPAPTAPPPPPDLPVIVGSSPDGPASETLPPPPPPPPPPQPGKKVERPPSQLCAGKTVYVQIFGPEQRDSVAALREQWQLLGAKVPAVEDVWDSARRNGRHAPKAAAINRLVVHDYQAPDWDACAKLLTSRVKVEGSWTIQPLPSRLTPTPGVIEVWLAPPAATAQAPAGY